MSTRFRSGVLFGEETDDILLEDVVLLVKKYRPFIRVTDSMKEVAKTLTQKPV